MGLFCLMVELHREGSAINGATPSSLVSLDLGCHLIRHLMGKS